MRERERERGARGAVEGLDRTASSNSRQYMTKASNPDLHGKSTSILHIIPSNARRNPAPPLDPALHCSNRQCTRSPLLASTLSIRCKPRWRWPSTDAIPRLAHRRDISLSTNVALSSGSVIPCPAPLARVAPSPRPSYGLDLSSSASAINTRSDRAVETTPALPWSCQRRTPAAPRPPRTMRQRR
jgi:hypothetical protein